MSKIVFKINGKQFEADGKYGPDVSLNEYIRTVADLRGTKAMCHEGGCGACIVAVRASLPPSYEMKTFSVNSCLVSVLSCHGWEVLTVEGIGNRTVGYHKIQSRLANFNGTQCGYCTPGWIMNMYSVYESKNKKLSMKEVENSFASNICRCTGYRPIADAFKTFATDVDDKLQKKLHDIEDLEFFKTCSVKCKKECLRKKNNSCNINSDPAEDDWCILDTDNNKMIVIDCGSHKWYKAYTLDDVFKAMGNSDDYKLVAGNTGQGVYHVTNYPSNVIDIFNVVELKGYSMDVNLVLGAGMPLSEMMDLFLELSSSNEDFSYLKQLHEHMDLVAHIPVRNIGTIGGNLFMKYTNNDFQSDIFLLFEAVGGMVTIDTSSKKNTINLPEFLKLNMKGKIIVNILLPPLSGYCSFKSYKIMPRSQNAHAVVNAAFLLQFHHNSKLLEKASLVFGSITGNFIHASKTEAILVGKDPFSEQTLNLALKTLHREIDPEEMPPEPSAAYRKMLAVTLFYKAILYLCPDDKLNKRYRSGGDAIKRHTSNGTQIFDTDKSVWPLNQPVPKLEALVQASGEATFANDLPTVTGEVYGAFVTADVRPGSTIRSFNADEALKMPGVIAFYTAKDIPGDNTFTPLNVPFMLEKEEILCSETVKYYGEPAGIIVADREKTANMAAKLVKISYLNINENRPLLTVEDVLNSPTKDKRLTNNVTIKPTDTGNDVKCIIHGEYKMETQHHFYMEPQTCVVKPTEDGMEVYSATQWLDLSQVAIAQSLNLPMNSINVIVRRVGGSYGGKITRSSHVACAAALVSHLQGRTCRFVLPLQTNMKIIGKRLPTSCNFEVGVNKEGEIQHLKNTYYQNNGCGTNETSITGIAAKHFLNCYDSKRWYIEGNSVITDTPSNTWCRAPSSTEGLAMIEYIMERIAYNTGKDPLCVRLLNMAKEDNPVPDLIEQIKKDSDYDTRLEEVKLFNFNNRWRKRALKVMPMTYDLYYLAPYNSIVTIFHADATVVITHGGIEMGQGINTKVAQVCAYMFGIPLEMVSVKPSASFTSPNTMTTGASIGSECVAFATMKACEIILDRLQPIREKMEKPIWKDVVTEAFKSGIDLQASHMFSGKEGVKTYDIYGVVVMELEVDILTGNHDIRRVDLLEDTGRSMNPEIDVGQIEGAFVMGIGYWTSEKTVYDANSGKLLTDRTWTYKPPGIKDIPADFRIYFRRNASNKFGVLQSKATGEPALCLAVVVTHALREAVRAARLDAQYADQWVEINNPCTVENIFMAVGHKLEHFKLT